MHGASACCEPHQQGMWSVFEVFLDTVVCCTLTALVILTSKAENYSVNKAFEHIFGSYSNVFILVCISLFAFCTIIGWYYCGETAYRYVSKNRYVRIYTFMYSALTAIGAVLALEAVWTVSDIFNGLMTFPNLLALLLLSNFVKKHKHF